MEKAMRVILADDQPGVRSAVRLMLEQQGGFDVVAEVSSAKDLVARLQDSPADVVLLDWELPGVRAVHLVPVLRSIAPHVSVVVLSGRPEAKAAAEAAAADAFVSKGEAPETLTAALLAVRARRRS